MEDNIQESSEEIRKVVAESEHRKIKDVEEIRKVLSLKELRIKQDPMQGDY